MNMKFEGNSAERGLEGEVEVGHDQNTLHVCMKFSKNNKIYSIF